MENDSPRHLDLLEFDEQTETWYVDTRETRRVALTRSTLEGLVELFNSIHRGNPLVLSNRKAIDRLEENNRRLSETIRDLYLRIDSDERRRPRRLLSKLTACLIERLLRRGR
jgi:hypothetical protein